MDSQTRLAECSFEAHSQDWALPLTETGLALVAWIMELTPDLRSSSPKCKDQRVATNEMAYGKALNTPSSIPPSPPATLQMSQYGRVLSDARYQVPGRDETSGT